jgi:DNA repair protein RadC
LSDTELLGVLVGVETAKKCSMRPLSEIIDGRGADFLPHPKIQAARELVMRSLRLEIMRRDALSSPPSVRDYLRLLLRAKEYEVFVVIFLDAQNRLIASEEMFRGTLTQTSVYPREVVKEALRHNAASVVFAHNHPSGIAEPSMADETITKALKLALVLIDVKVLDHIVVAGNAVTSFAERGIL